MTTQTHTPVIRGVVAPPAVVKLDALSRAAARRMRRVQMQQSVAKAKRVLDLLRSDCIPMSGGASKFVRGLAAGVVLAASVFMFALALLGEPS